MAFLNIPAEYANKTIEEVSEKASTVGSKFPLIPEGWYQMVIVSDTFDEETLVYRPSIVITEGQYRDTELQGYFRFKNDDEWQTNATYDHFGLLCNAVGLTGSFAAVLKDTTKIHNKKFMGNVVTKKGTQYNDKTTGELRDGNASSRLAIKNAFKPLPKVGVGVSAPQTSGVAPAKAAMPWEKK